MELLAQCASPGFSGLSACGNIINYVNTEQESVSYYSSARLNEVLAMITFVDKNAPTGIRTRVARMGILHATPTPLALVKDDH